MLVTGSTACGRTPLDEGPATPPGDASTLDAAGVDATLRYVEATVADSYVAPDQGTAADSALEGSPSLDAAEGPDANADASTSEAGDASEGGVQRLTCDQCNRGDQQCVRLPQVCTYDDAGLFHCDFGAQTIGTCVVGDAGCAVWDQGLACRSDVPCCVPCMYAFTCLGGLGNPCEQDTDCASNACDAFAHVCGSNQCADRRLDGQESDVDCGGPDCGACNPGRRCRNNGDCFSGHLCAASGLCE
jgi:hypothetical protein